MLLPEFFSFRTHLCLVLTATICVSGCGSSSSDNNGASPSKDACSVIGLGTEARSTRIVDGSDCQAGNSPVVFLEIDGAACTGTMVSPIHILTAAHCFESRPSEVLVRTRASAPVTASASRVIVHPGADLNTPTGIIPNDVAIVELPRPVGLPTLPVLTGRKAESGDIISIFGFGQSLSVPANQGFFTVGVLRSGQMQVTEVKDKQIFAVFTDESSNTCFGDSGGPAVETLTLDDGSVVTGLVGVTSAGSSDTCRLEDNSNFAELTDPDITSFLRTFADDITFRDVSSARK